VKNILQISKSVENRSSLAALVGNRNRKIRSNQYLSPCPENVSQMPCRPGSGSHPCSRFGSQDNPDRQSAHPAPRRPPGAPGE